MSNPIQIACFVDPNFGENAYVVWAKPAGACWIVDPGLPPSAQEMLRFIKERQLKPAALVLTHGHADHIAGVPEILEALPDLTVYISNAARPALTDPHENLSSDLGMPIQMDVTNIVDLAASSELDLDGVAWKILDTSGHAPGSRSLYCAAAALVIAGDALFHSSIGRTDFHHSDHDTLIRNIKENLLTLPEDTQVLSGHGPVTTIGRERRHNPYVQ